MADYNLCMHHITLTTLCLCDVCSLACCAVANREVEKAGGKLPDGWTVQLGNKQPSGYYKGNIFKEASTGECGRDSEQWVFQCAEPSSQL